MCSIYLDPNFTVQLDSKQLRDKSKKIKKRLFQFADEADRERPGALDDLSCHMTRRPDSLKEVKKKRIGRHRVFYTGTHRDCRYDVVYIKPFKKSGTDDDDDQDFQNRLINLLTKSDSANNILLELPKT